MWPRVVFPGRPLRVERRGCLSQGERSAGAVPGSLLFGARSDSFVLSSQGARETWFSVAGRRVVGDKELGSKRSGYAVRN